METIFENLMKTYEKTGRIGKVKPFDYNHAKKIAYAVAVSITNKTK